LAASPEAPLPLATEAGFEAYLDLSGLPPGEWTLQLGLALPDGCAYLPVARQFVIG
jgi:hypothetical protein